MTTGAHSFVMELEQALGGAPSSTRGVVLRKVTALFLDNAEAYTSEHVGLFDDVIGYLMQKIERAAVIELSGALAPIGNAPPGVIGRLAREEDEAIAEPVLTHSPLLTDADLREIASSRGQAHLAAIASRRQISECVTDLLVSRGDARVTLTVSSNHGARFSQTGLAELSRKAEQDATLAAAIAARKDVPAHLFDDLVLKATQAVRDKLLANADIASHDQIRQTLARIARKVAPPTGSPPPSRQGTRGLRHNPQRLRAELLQFVHQRRTPEVITTLASLCQIPPQSIRGLARQHAVVGVIILGKFAELGWNDVKAILSQIIPGSIPDPDVEKELFETYIGLTAATSGHVIRFVRASRAAAVEDINRLL